MHNRKNTFFIHKKFWGTILLNSSKIGLPDHLTQTSLLSTTFIGKNLISLLLNIQIYKNNIHEKYIPHFIFFYIMGSYTIL